ncbi:MAG: hypothetical protein R6V03_03475 [Kiritimatiellia bacterium]
MKKTEQSEKLLNDFSAGRRREALEELAGTLPRGPGSETANHNMHLHSFFSYNARGWSPSRIAWEARKAGLHAAGLCDFDVLDGLEEFLEAGRKLFLRAAVNIETRAFLAEYADYEISSPGEPGVTYIMGAGFPRVPEKGSEQELQLNGYRESARSRNMEVIAAINGQLPDIAIDYENDVLPLTPAGGATERHIVRAYINKAGNIFADISKREKYWAGVLGQDLSDTAKLMKDETAFGEKVRARLVKRGGMGYRKPSPRTFPPVGEFMKWTRACGAVPMVAWLDGTSEGEKDGRALLECAKSKGASALNIIPDRNWNIADREECAVKTENLRTIIETAEDMGFPVNIGTEMNKPGLPFVDDLECEALSPYRDIFLKGADIIVGHTLLGRYADYGYPGEKAREDFGDVEARNGFFAAAGALPPMNEETARRLEDMGPLEALKWFKKRVA